jgi:hypothetical protein
VVKGKLLECISTNGAVTITKGKVTGSFASSPLSCKTDSTTGAPASLTVTWKGSVTGYSGKATFTATTLIGGTSTGSFAGGATITVDAPSDLATPCGAKKGIKSLVLTGTTTIGSNSSTSANWPQDGYGPDRTGLQPNETAIDIGNVSGLSEARTYGPAVPVATASSPLITDGTLFDDIDGTLSAFDASGNTDCSPTVCRPEWTIPSIGDYQYDGMTTGDGEVFVTDRLGVQAYDAAGIRGCSGTPKLCNPLWTETTFTPSSGRSPLVDNGVLYVPGASNGGPLDTGGAYVAAFDAAGCNATVCAPMWTTTGPVTGGGTGPPTVSNGVLYVDDGPLLAFDATESSAYCTTGTPAVCSPMWTGTISTTPSGTAPAVASAVTNGVDGGTVYVTAGNNLYSFGANGTTNCSGPTLSRTCTPLWTADTGSQIYGSPAVANGTVFALSSNGYLYAFDDTGGSNCSGPTLSRTCTPLWTSTSSDEGENVFEQTTSLAIANGVIYFRAGNGDAVGLDAAGSVGCSVTNGAKTCAPILNANPGNDRGTPIVANGVVYVSNLNTGTISAFSLPQ